MFRVARRIRVGRETGNTHIYIYILGGGGAGGPKWPLKATCLSACHILADSLDCTAFNPRGFIGLLSVSSAVLPPSNVLTLPCDIRCRPPELTDYDGPDTWLAHLVITSLLQVRHLIYLFLMILGPTFKRLCILHKHCSN